MSLPRQCALALTLAVLGGSSLCAVPAAAASTLGLTATETATVGGSIAATATLTEVSAEAEGSISFEVFGPAAPDCEGTPLSTLGPASVSGPGDYGSGSFPTTAAGSYRWIAHYTGDGLGNEAADSACVGSTVAKASPTLSAVATAGVTVGASITDQATLSGGFGALSGELTFLAYGPGDPGCAGAPAYEETVTVTGAGSYSPPGFAPPPGAYRWTVEYTGDADNLGDATTCGESGQTSQVAKATPALSALATSATVFGESITDQATLSGGFGALSGELIFRAYGPGDPGCAGVPAYEEAVTVEAAGSYSPPGFAPPPGAYRWTVEYSGDADNATAFTTCDAPGQTSAVGMLSVNLVANAVGGIVGVPLSAAAALGEGATPTGLITFTAFAPGDVLCLGPPAFSSTVAASGPGAYGSAPFTPAAPGTYRWSVAYSGDVHHLPATTACGLAVSSVGKATPSIAGKVKRKVTVGTAFPDWATLSGGFAPTGTITFQIYDPRGNGCSKVAFVNQISIAGNGVFSSEPVAAPRPGRYRFSVSYSGDAANHPAAEPCGSPAQVVRVLKRKPRVVPRVKRVGKRLIAIRARLLGATEPAGKVRFRLYRPGDRRCKRRPVFGGAVSVSSNGGRSLAKYFATRRGAYRLVVAYTGDELNRRYDRGCRRARVIRIR